MTAAPPKFVIVIQETGIVIFRELKAPPSWHRRGFSVGMLLARAGRTARRYLAAKQDYL
ncbi:hypothetical protein P3W85_36080 [Cupriavidus basilensis]|uniref:Uncharacterized protein n=1 Tax=Cupriavidus basilensis TaxID=68895 RepID=A0ABT6B093_9BURK|nr:hypothetical protein [Cupriavidus basilensis]MDF3838309.1 hypothetical protein [Cupriavidus basilensis]